MVVCTSSIYGASKLAGELAIQAAGGDILIIRVSWVYAARGSNFLSTIVRLAQERKELRVVADQIGGPTPAALIASAVAQMISGGRENFVGRARKAHGLVHFAVARTVSWHGFAGAIIEGLRARGLPLAVEELVPIATDAYRTRAMRPRNCRFDLGRLKHVFAISPPHWQSALDRELDKVAANFLGRNS